MEKANTEKTFTISQARRLSKKRIHELAKQFLKTKQPKE